MTTEAKYIHFPELKSTNTYLASIADTEPEGTVVYADSQPAGRGQRGNSWESAPGKNITMSLLLHPAGRVKPAQQFWLSEVAAMAVVYTLDRYLPGGVVKVKWPNDIYWCDKKICGILVEHTLSASRLQNTIIGIGLNVNQQEFVSDAPNPVSIRQIIGRDTDLEEVLHTLSDEVLRLYDSLPHDAELLHDAFLESLYRRNGLYPYRALKDDETLKKGDEFRARIADVAPDGILTLVAEDGTDHHYAFKEVEIII